MLLSYSIRAFSAKNKNSGAIIQKMLCSGLRKNFIGRSHRICIVNSFKCQDLPRRVRAGASGNNFAPAFKIETGLCHPTMLSSTSSGRRWKTARRVLQHFFQRCNSREAPLPSRPPASCTNRTNPDSSAGSPALFASTVWHPVSRHSAQAIRTSPSLPAIAGEVTCQTTLSRAKA